MSPAAAQQSPLRCSARYASAPEPRLSPGLAPQGAARATRCPMQGRSSPSGTSTGTLKHRTSISSTDTNWAWDSKTEHPAFPEPLSWEGRGTARRKRQEMGLPGGSCVEGNGKKILLSAPVPGLGSLRVSPHLWWASVQGAEQGLLLQAGLWPSRCCPCFWDQKSHFGTQTDPVATPRCTAGGCQAVTTAQPS